MMSSIRRLAPCLPFVGLLALTHDAVGLPPNVVRCTGVNTSVPCKMADGRPGKRACEDGILQVCEPLPAPRPQLPGRYDLVRTPAFAELDDNGIRLNPQWRAQAVYPREIPNIGAGGNDCGGTGTTQPWEAPCTSQHTSDDAPGAGEGALEYLGNATGVHPGSCGSGHHNWMPVTYTGPIYWESHSSSHSDDDYNFRILTPPPAPELGLNPALGGGTTMQSLLVYPPTFEVISREGSIKVWPATRDPFPASDGVPSLGIEFDSDETIDHFTTGWWSRFHDAVDAFGNDRGTSYDCYRGNPSACTSTSKLFGMINGKFAIVTGLMGMDTAHGIYPEIHPAYAMAIRVNDDPSDETWEIFVRRSGDEGWCSSNQHFLDNLPSDTYTFRLPPQGTTAQVTSEEWGTDSGSITRTFPVTADARLGKLVQFTIPAPHYVGPILVSDMIHGELHLKWSGPKPVPPHTVPGATGAGGTTTRVGGIAPAVAGGAGAPPTPSRPEPEEALENLMATMTPAQKQLFTSKLGVKPAPKRHDKPALLAGARGVSVVPVPRPSPTPLPVGGSTTPSPSTHAVPDLAKRAADQRLVDALHAVYGPNLNQNLPRPRVAPHP